MDPIEISYDSIDAVPEAFRPLYEEQDGKAVLSGVNGLKTQADVDRVQEALRKERNDHSEAQRSIKAWGDLKPDEVRSQLDRIQELEAAAEGKIDDDKINQIVESRLGQKTGPLQRQLEGLAEERDTFKNQYESLQNELVKRDRNDSVRSIAQEMKVHSTAIPDIEMAASYMLEQTEDGQFITKDGISGVTPGLDVKGFMREMQKTRPHWWPASEGGGAQGAGAGGFGGQNPWSADNWNFTEQSRIMQEQGREVADRMARAAGTKVGGGKPVSRR